MEEAKLNIVYPVELSDILSTVSNLIFEVSHIGQAPEDLHKNIREGKIEEVLDAIDMWRKNLFNLDERLQHCYQTILAFQEVKLALRRSRLSSPNSQHGTNEEVL